MMEALIRLFLKIIKIIFGAILILVLFIFANVISMTTLSYLSREDFKNEESPGPFFTLVFETYEEFLDQTRFYCVRWADFEKMDCKDPSVDISVKKLICVDRTSKWPREYHAYLSVTNGSCSNLSSDFEVETVGPNEQIVRLQWSLEAFKVENHYSVVSNKIIPLYFRKFMSSDIVVFGVLISLVLTTVFVLICSFCINKYKKSKPNNKTELIKKTRKDENSEKGES